MAQTVGFSRALATVRRTVAARRDAKRRARAVRIPPCSPCKVCCKNKKQHPARCCSWRRRWDSNPRGIAAKLISSQSRYPDFEGKRRKLTDNARVCKPLKNQHFSALEGRKSRKPRQSKEFERNPVLGRKKPVGEKMGRTRGEITVQCR